MNQSLSGTLQPQRMGRQSKCTSNVRAELNRYSHAHDDVHQGQRIQFYLPKHHETKQASRRHTNSPHDDQSRPDVESEENQSDDKYGEGTYGQIDGRVVSNVEVLIVEDVEDAKEQTHVN